MSVEYTSMSTEALLKISPVHIQDEASYKCEITYLEVRENCDVVQIIKLTTLGKLQHLTPTKVVLFPHGAQQPGEKLPNKRFMSKETEL